MMDVPIGAKNLSGLRFGRLFVVGLADGRAKGGELLWRVRCDCGGQHVVRGSHLRKGSSRSCGCLRRELGSLAAAHQRLAARSRMPVIPKEKQCKRCQLIRPASAFTPHYLSRDGLHGMCVGCVRYLSQRHGMYGTPTWIAWQAMQARCRDPKRRDYGRYGGRGITVCARWETFELFFADMGTRPAGTTLDRIDGDGHYEPGNCRWATAIQQNRNRSNNRRLTYRGMTLCIADWSERTGISPTTLWRRLKRGWSVEQALGLPLMPNQRLHRA